MLGRRAPSQVGSFGKSVRTFAARLMNAWESRMSRGAELPVSNAVGSYWQAAGFPAVGGS